MSRANALSLDQYSNNWLPLMGALGFHVMLIAWNPNVITPSAYKGPSQAMEVKILDAMPVVEPPKALPKPTPKPEPVVKKAKKAGLQVNKNQALTVSKKPAKAAPPAPAPKPKFVSKIEMPKFVPRSNSEEAIAASPAPGLSAPAPRRAMQLATPAPVLKGKTRGVRAGDVNFQLTDRGSAMAGGGRVVAIPIGETAGDVASLPPAAIFHEAPKGAKAVQGYRFKPGEGSSAEGLGKDRGSSMGGYHGVAKADAYIEGSLNAASGGKGSGKVVTGQGFEMGGPVGDRKILKRKMPQYPSWAEEKGITAMVKIYFTVRPDGMLRQNMRILSSSGYTELDQIAKDALMSWRFSPTSASSSEQEAWGVITFRFTLN